jgi:hypothetical protein
VDGRFPIQCLTIGYPSGTDGVRIHKVPIKVKACLHFPESCRGGNVAMVKVNPAGVNLALPLTQERGKGKEFFSPGKGMFLPGVIGLVWLKSVALSG